MVWYGVRESREFKLLHTNSNLEDKIKSPTITERLQPDLVASENYRCVLQSCGSLDPRRTVEALSALGRSWTPIERSSTKFASRGDPQGPNAAIRPVAKRSDDRRLESCGGRDANLPKFTRPSESLNANARKSWRAADDAHYGHGRRDVQEPPRNNTMYKYYDRSDSSKRKAPLLSPRETREGESPPEPGNGAFQTASKRFAIEKSQKEGNNNHAPYFSNGDGVRAPYKPPVRCSRHPRAAEHSSETHYILL